MSKKDGFGHEKPYEGDTNDWITPRWIIKAFDEYSIRYFDKPNFFDLDPCASITQPWACARDAYTVEQNGLLQNWYGNVWCNPPYGPNTEKWVRRLAEHGSGVALIFARIETALWQDWIFPTASGFLFPRRRIQFSRPNGETPKSSSGAPSAIIAWGNDNREALIELCDTGAIDGAFLEMAFYTRSYRNAGEAQKAHPEFFKQAALGIGPAESGEEPAALD